MAILVVALVSVFGTLHGFEPQAIDWVLDQGDKGNFWLVFAVFFPVVTGIMAGLNMSGELADPRTSIPKGTLAAVGVCTVIYLVLAWWCSVTISSQELRENMSAMIDYALWPWVVIAGLLGATFSSGLSSLVGAPRILQALAQHRVVPQSRRLALQSESGEPRNAVLFTGLVVLLALMMRDLNAIATLLTMFFLIAYAVLNVVTMIEQKLALSSFRPMFRLHPLVPTAGALGCVLTILVIHPLAGLSALILVGGFYGYLLGKKLEALRGSFFRPNILFLALPEDQNQDGEMASVATQARDNGLGVLVYLEHP